MKLFRPKTLLVLFLCVFCGTLGFGWLRQGPSDQELLANFAKAIDYLRGFLSVKGWPWWTPDFMGGQPLAATLGTLLSSFWMLLGSGLFGPFQGLKIMGLLSIAVSGLTMYGFAKAFSRSEWAGLVCAIFYVTCPQLSLRLAGSEHFVVAMCFPYPPLILWALLLLAGKASWRNGVLFAMALAAMALTFAKLAILFLPVVALFSAWLYRSRPECRRNLRRGLLRAAFPSFILGALPLLPAVREFQWMSLFLYDPFRGWQQSFSIKTALSWFDRGGAVMAGAPMYFRIDEGGFYLGGAAILAFGCFFLWKRDEFLQSELGRKCRVFMGLFLFIHWLSFGPRSVFGGHREFLRFAQGVQNWILPLFWFALAAQIWIIIRLWPACRWRPFWITLGLVVYLFMPGFFLMERIPGFGEIRAPWSFWQVGGSFCLSMAAGLAVVSCLRYADASALGEHFRSRFVRVALGALALILGLVDLSAYQKFFFEGATPKATLDDFLAAEAFLFKAHRPGRVYAFSGRYFYLMTPYYSLRTLGMESFSAYYMPRWARAANDAGQSAPDLVKAYLNVNGFSFIFIDKGDKDLPPTLPKSFRNNFPVAFENGQFLILENRSSLSPAFLAREFIAMPPESYGFASQILSYAQFYLLPVEVPPDAAKDCAGSLNPKGEIEIKDAYKTNGGTPFRIVDLGPAEEHNLRANFHRIEFPPLDQKGGWLVVGESYHPDWKAYTGGRQIPVRRAMGSLLAVQLPETPAPVPFRYEAPWWYSASEDVSLAGWLVCGTLVLAGVLGSGEWQRGWFSGLAPAVPPEIAGAGAKPIVRSLVIVPVSDDAKNLATLLAGLSALPKSVDMLIVDDASSGGVAEIVKRHGEFGRRLFLVQRAEKAGVATACREGFEWALQRDYDACVEMSADLSHDPADIPRLLEALDEGADVAVGSRYLDGIRVLNWPQTRLQASLLAAFYARTLSGLPLTDPASGFKAIRREALESMDWSRFIAEGHGFEIETNFYAWRNGFRLREVPIVFTAPREGPRPRDSWRAGAETAWRVLRLLPERLEPFGAGRVKKTEEQG